MPTNVSTSFFFINLLFQARRAGSNPRPSCVPRCVAARDKSRPGRRAMARAHQEGCARARGVAGRGLEKPGILRGAWPHGTSCARGGGLMARAYRESCVRARGVVGRGLEKLSHWGVWPGAVHLGWSKSPRWMGARRCAGVPCQAGRGGNRSGPNCFLVSFAQKLDAKNTGIPVKQRERHFAVILVGQGKQFSCIYNF